MRHRYILAGCLLALITNMVLAVEQNKQRFSYDDYAAVLKSHVNNEGLVNYKKLKARPQKLESFVVIVDKLDPKSYSKYDDKEKIAFWLNAYNAFILKVIIDNYPIKPNFFKSAYYPKNSIRQIVGVWDKINFKVMGKNYTLEQIEHKILRKGFKEPRIHMAMVCAAMSCPPLRNEPYIDKKLDQQLDDQSRKFLANPKKFRIDYESGSMYLSPIFKWFAKDFVKTYGMKKKYRGHKNLLVAVIKFIDKHLPEEIAQKRLADSRTYKITYLDYDWSLNEQK